MLDNRKTNNTAFIAIKNIFLMLLILALNMPLISITHAVNPQADIIRMLEITGSILFLYIVFKTIVEVIKEQNIKS